VRVIVVGERMNRTTWRPRGWPTVMRQDRYWELMLRLGAFRDGQSRVKLASLGLGDCDAVNLLPPDPQGVPWEAERAEEVASVWLDHLREYDGCLLAGARVAAAVGLRGRMTDLLGRRSSVFGVRVVVIPHPSGLNRFWNSSIAVESLKEKLSSILK
jgi:hypothetical protein